MSTPGAFRVCRSEELAEGQILDRQVDGRREGVSRGPMGLRAFAPRCPHRQADLTAGFLDAHGLTCPDHLWHFDLDSGQCTLIPGVRIPVYPVREEGGWVIVELPRA